MARRQLLAGHNTPPALCHVRGLNTVHANVLMLAPSKVAGVTHGVVADNVQTAMQNSVAFEQQPCTPLSCRCQRQWLPAGVSTSADLGACDWAETPPCFARQLIKLNCCSRDSSSANREHRNRVDASERKYFFKKVFLRPLQLLILCLAGLRSQLLLRPLDHIRLGAIQP
jgi:hypothetical protein